MKRRSVLLSGVALSGTALANDSIFFSPLKYLGAEQQRSIDASQKFAGQPDSAEFAAI